MRAAVASALAVALLGLASMAVAQQPEAPSGNYGGGRATSPSKPLTGAGSALVSLRVARGRAQVQGNAGTRCSGGRVRTTGASFRTTVAPDATGSFARSGETRRSAGGLRQTTRYRLRGNVAGGQAIGTIAVRVRVTEGERTLATCSSGTVRWSARRPAGELGALGAQPGALLFGTTAQRDRGLREPIVLRVSRDAGKLSRAFFGFSFRCPSGRELGYTDAPRPSVAIAADGTFEDRERHTYRSGGTVSHVRERFSGQLGALGARGTFSVVARRADRRTGRTIERCSSGTVRWVAAA